MNYKMFRVVRDYHENDHSEKLNIKKCLAGGKQMRKIDGLEVYSLSDLRRLGPKFVKDKVFESCYEPWSQTNVSESSII